MYIYIYIYSDISVTFKRERTQQTRTNTKQVLELTELKYEHEMHALIYHQSHTTISSYEKLLHPHTYFRIVETKNRENDGLTPTI